MLSGCYKHYQTSIQDFVRKYGCQWRLRESKVWCLGESSKNGYNDSEDAGSCRFRNIQTIKVERSFPQEHTVFILFENDMDRGWQHVGHLTRNKPNWPCPGSPRVPTGFCSKLHSRVKDELKIDTSTLLVLNLYHRN